MPSTAHIEMLSISPEDARDQALVLLARNGDKGAVSQLLAAHQDRVFAICLRMTSDRDAAEDLAQETMLKVIRGLDQFNNRSKFTTWLTRVAMNVCLTAFRKNRIRRTVSLDAMADPSATWGFASWWKGMSESGFGSMFGFRGGNRDSSSTGAFNPAKSGMFRSSLNEDREPDAHERVELSESLSRLYRALAKLEPDQRALLILRDMQGLDYHTIAQVLEVPNGTVKSRLFRARTALREIFESLPPNE